MPPCVILIRHAQAEHNATKNWQIPDPHLTELGLQQCKELQEYLKKNTPLADKIELIITSPFRRTLQTTHLGLGWLMDRGVPVVTRPEWQENAAKPCDTGSPRQQLEEEFPQFDFSHLDTTYPAKTDLYAYTRKAVLERGVVARKWLKARPEKVIAVVTHSAFLRTSIAHSRFANADYRIYDFETKPDSIELVEWQLTEQNSGGMGRSEKGYMAIEEGDFPDAEEELQERPVK